jgi:translation initiation factor 2 subunit 1
MLHKKTGMPEEGECVFCTVTKVQFHSVFVELDEYPGKQGMIHISEISPGRIRNINDFVKEGKVIVCKVLKINRERGHIDLSLRRVNESQRRAKVEERKQEIISESIIVTYAEHDKTNKQKPEVVFEHLSKVLLKKYPSIFFAFEDVVENNADLTEIGLEKEIFDKLEPIIRERIKIKEVSIGGTITIHSYESNGVNLICDLMDKAMKVSDLLDIKTLGAGNYSMKISAPEYKEAEEILKNAIEILEKGLKGTNTEFSFKRE